MFTAKVDRAADSVGASTLASWSSSARTLRKLDWRDIAITSLVAALLLWPVLALIAHGYTPTGMAEESLGRRYFYSLRIVYGDNERPWVPQGQLVSLTHMAIQVALTAAGFPPTQLFPRIDVFAFSASILTVAVTLVAFMWAIRPINDGIGKLLVALLLLAMVFDPATTRGYHLVTTDYYAWVHPIALVGVGMMLRVANAGTTLGLRSGLLLGAYVAGAVAIKPTYLIFVIPPGILLLIHALTKRAWLSVAVGGMTALVIATVGAGAAHLAYYGWDVGAAIEHLEALAGFVGVMSSPVTFQSWLQMALGRWQYGETLLGTIMLVPVLVLSLLLLPNRAVTLSLLPGAAVAVYVAWRRFYPNTLIETNDYLFFAAVVWAALVLVPAARARFRPKAEGFRPVVRVLSAALPIAGLVLVLALSVRVAEHAAGGVGDILTSFGATTWGSRALAEHLASQPGQVAFLIPGNTFRPLTVDTGIYKGGTDELDPHWGDSSYVHAMFPDRHYFVDRLHPERDSDPAEFNRIVFVRQPDEWSDAEAARRLLDSFGVSLRGYRCDFRVDVIYQEIVACERRVAVLSDATGQTARFLSDGGTESRGARPHELVARQAVAGLVATARPKGTGVHLWQIADDQSVTQVKGAKGSHVWIEGLGVWDFGRRDFAGIGATFLDGQWRLDTANVQASNDNPRFTRFGSRRQPLAGWQLEPRDATPIVEHLSDQAGPFVRIRPALPGKYVTIYSRSSLSRLDDTPVTLRATIRVHGPRPATLTISDVVAAGGEVVTRSAQVGASDGWQVVSLWLSRASFPSDRDSFSIHLADAAENSWVDLREVSLIPGIVP